MNVVFLRSNPVNPDPRVEKEISTLLGDGYAVSLLCWDRSASLPHQDVIDVDGRACRVVRCSLKSNYGGGLRNIFKLILFQVFLLFNLLKARRSIDVIHAADFDTVLPAVMMKIFWRKKVVYDVYDFYVESFSVPRLIKPLIRRIDLWIMGFVDAVVLTNETRLEQISGATPKRIYYLHNTPRDCDVVSDKGAIRCCKISAAYVGILQEGRLLLEVAEVFKLRPEWQLTIAGFGALEQDFLNLASEYQNISYMGRVEYARGLELSANADVLFATYDPNIPNHKYSSPNKLYEAMMLSKPIIVCSGTGVDAVVEKYKLGCVIPYDQKSFERALEGFSQGEAVLREMGGRGRQLYESEYSWSVMGERLLQIYRDI